MSAARVPALRVSPFARTGRPPPHRERRNSAERGRGVTVAVVGVTGARCPLNRRHVTKIAGPCCVRACPRKLGPHVQTFDPATVGSLRASRSLGCPPEPRGRRRNRHRRLTLLARDARVCCVDVISDLAPTRNQSLQRSCEVARCGPAGLHPRLCRTCGLALASSRARSAGLARMRRLFLGALGRGGELAAPHRRAVCPPCAGDRPPLVRPVRAQTETAHAPPCRRIHSSHDDVHYTQAEQHARLD